MSNQAASRRSTLLMAGAGLGAALIPLSAAPAAAAAEPVPTADPISAQPAPMAPLMVTEPYRKTLNYGWHVARRLSLAPTHALAEEINKAGWQAWIQAQLYKDSTFSSKTADSLIMQYYPAGVLSHEKYIDYPEKYRFAAHNRAANMLRRVYTGKHLREVMVEFWGDLVHVHSNNDAARGYLTDYDNRQRKYALGKFSDLLYQSIMSPAMLRMLTNNTNTAKNVNENLGREILELHSVGVRGGYTEADVRQSALLFTGLRVNSQTFTTEFVPRNHYFGALKIMGFKHANATGTTGDQLVKAYTKYLASHPSTALRIANRLIARFCYEEVTPETKKLAGQLAATYTANGTDIRPVLNQLFNSSVFKTSIGRKIARPSHIIARNYAAMKPVFTPAAGAFKEDLGHYAMPPLLDGGHRTVEDEYRGHPSPEGSPDEWSYWMSTNTFRYVTGTLAELSAGQTDSWFYSTGWAKILGVSVNMTVTDIANRLYGRIHGFYPDPATRALLVQTLSRFGVTNQKPAARALQNDTMKLTMQLVFAAPHSFIR